MSSSREGCFIENEYPEELFECLQTLNHYKKENRILDIEKNAKLIMKIIKRKDIESNLELLFYGKKQLSDMNVFHKAFCQANKRLKLIMNIVRKLSQSHNLYFGDFVWIERQFSFTMSNIEALNHFKLKKVEGIVNFDDYRKKKNSILSAFLSNGITIESLSEKMIFIKIYYEKLKEFIKMYIFNPPNDFIIYSIIRIEKYEYSKIALISCKEYFTFELTHKYSMMPIDFLKLFCNNFMRFFTKQFSSNQLISDDRLMLNQRPKKALIPHFNETDFTVWNKIKNLQIEEFTGYLYDYIYYDDVSNNSFPLFEWFANVLSFELDDKMKRMYRVNIDYDQNTICMSSELNINHDLKEFQIYDMNIYIRILYETSEKKMIIQSENLFTHIQFKTKIFKYGNFRSDHKTSLILGPQSFLDNEGFVHFGEENVVFKGFFIFHEPNEFPFNIIKILDKSKEVPEILNFCPLKRLGVFNEIGFHESLDDTILPELQQINSNNIHPEFNPFNNYFVKHSEKDYHLDFLYQGFFKKDTGEIVIGGYLFFSLNLELYQTKIKITFQEIQLLFDNPSESYKYIL